MLCWWLGWESVDFVCNSVFIEALGVFVVLLVCVLSVFVVCVVVFCVCLVLGCCCGGWWLGVGGVY